MRDKVVLAWMSSAHDLMSITSSSGAKSGVPHPSCLGARFFRMSLVSPPMMSVSANFRSGSAQAVGLNLRFFSVEQVSPIPSSSATILVLVHSLTVSSHTEPLSQIPAQPASNLGPPSAMSWLVSCLGRATAAMMRRFAAACTVITCGSRHSMAIAAPPMCAL